MLSNGRWVVFVWVLFLAVGCQPNSEDAPALAEKDESVSSPKDPDAELVPNKPDYTAPAGARIDTGKQASFIVLNQPWDKYFAEPPSILLVDGMSKGIAELLREEQALIKSVLDSGSEAGSSSEYVLLEDKLDQLKSVIPQAETSSGYVRSTARTRYPYTYAGYDYAYSSYYRRYYTVMRQKSASSSPEMIRSVEGIAHNATLEDLDQRIQALQSILSKWRKQTSEMNPNGTTGIVREANEVYLAGLQNYLSDFQEIRRELRQVEAKQDQIVQNRAVILQEWQAFENSRLPVLEEYFNSNAVARVTANAEGMFVMKADDNLDRIYACKIGTRMLYFKLSTNDHTLHPFTMVNVGQGN